MFGLAPALHATGSHLIAGLRSGRGTTASRLRLRSVLLGAQVTLSVVLLAAAVLLVRGVQHAGALDPGFGVKNVAVVSFELPARTYDGPRTRALLGRVAEELEQIPGVDAFGFAAREPLTNSRAMTSFRMPGEREDLARTMMVLDASPGYFDVLRIPIVAGHPFDTANPARRVVLVNETLARRFWPGGSAVGQTFILSGRETATIAGVVKDAYTSGLDQVEPMIYQVGDGFGLQKVLVRTADANIGAVVGAIVARIDPRVHVQAAPLAATLDRHLASARVGAMLAGILGVFALSLATIY